MKETKNTSKFYFTAILILAVTVIVGRVISYFHSVTATDIAFADWVVGIFGWLGEIVPALRTSFGFAVIAAAVYYGDKKCTVNSVVITAAAAFADYAARFFIDLFSYALTGMEIIAAIWLVLQFVYEFVFIILALLVCMMLKKKYGLAETAVTREKYSCICAVRWSIVMVMLSRVVLEIYYLVDFLMNYTNITNTEIASIIGQFLKCIVIYGGIPLVLAEVFAAVFAALIAQKRPAKSEF